MRSAQHFGDYTKCSKNKNLEEGSSFMYDHITEHHKDQKTPDPNNFNFDIVTASSDPLTRQLTEAILIKRSLEDGMIELSKGKNHCVVSMNRKFEYFAPRQRIQDT